MNPANIWDSMKTPRKRRMLLDATDLRKAWRWKSRSPPRSPCILDEVERRRGVSAALVYPFMRSLMESPFPAPGKTIRVKTFLPGAGNEVIELRRPMDSRLEHVDFDSLFSCLI
ncbi:hypothetical protein CRUP_027129, partial [Coryphaenoides rupestris]